MHGACPDAGSGHACAVTRVCSSQLLAAADNRPRAGSGEAGPSFSGSGPRNAQQALARLLTLVRVRPATVLSGSESSA